MSIDRWKDKDVIYIHTHTHTHTHTYTQWNISHKKEWNNAICSNMDGPRDYHTKWSKWDRERQISYDITYMRNLKKSDANELIYETNRLTGVENKRMVTRGDSGIGREFGINIYTLLYIK